MLLAIKIFSWDKKFSLTALIKYCFFALEANTKKLLFWRAHKLKNSLLLFREIVFFFFVGRYDDEKPHIRGIFFSYSLQTKWWWYIPAKIARNNNKISNLHWVKFMITRCAYMRNYYRCYCLVYVVLCWGICNKKKKNLHKV